MGKFVLGVVVYSLVIAGIVANRGNVFKSPVGKAEALEGSDLATRAIRAVNQSAYECDVNKTCVRWVYGWHPQHQRVRNEVTTVEVRGWKCIGWAHIPTGVIPACDNEIMTREAGR